MDYFAVNICLCSSEERVEYSFKGTVHPKMIFFSFDVLINLFALKLFQTCMSFSSAEHIRHFEEYG